MLLQSGRNQGPVGVSNVMLTWFPSMRTQNTRNRSLLNVYFDLTYASAFNRKGSSCRNVVVLPVRICTTYILDTTDNTYGTAHYVIMKAHRLNFACFMTCSNPNWLHNSKTGPGP